jgi:hypothetical protein
MMNISSTETNTMTFYEQFFTSTTYTLAEIQGLGTTSEFNQDVFLQNHTLDLSEFFTTLNITNFTTVYKKATDGTYVQVSELQSNDTNDPDVSASLAIFNERLFNYTGTAYEEITYASGGVALGTIDTTNAVTFNEDTAANTPV